LQYIKLDSNLLSNLSQEQWQNVCNAFKHLGLNHPIKLDLGDDLDPTKLEQLCAINKQVILVHENNTANENDNQTQPEQDSATIELEGFAVDHGLLGKESQPLSKEDNALSTQSDGLAHNDKELYFLGLTYKKSEQDMTKEYDNPGLPDDQVKLKLRTS